MKQLYLASANLTLSHSVRPHLVKLPNFSRLRNRPKSGLLLLSRTPAQAKLRLIFELNLADVTNGRVTANGIAESLDVIEHIRPRFVVCPSDRASGPLGLERGEEALHCCVAPGVARPAHRTLHAVISHRLLKPIAAVLTSLVRVVQQGRRPALRQITIMRASVTNCAVMSGSKTIPQYGARTGL